MNFDEITKAIEDFRQKQQADADAFVNGLQESIKAAKEAQDKAKQQSREGGRRKRRYEYVYVYRLSNGLWAVRLHHQYGGGYFDIKLTTEQDAHARAKYINDNLKTMADVLLAEYRQLLITENPQ